MEVEIISKEKVKPSSHTPHIHKLSRLDEDIPPSFFPVLLYFLPDELNSDSAQKIQILKESLSLNLNRFYPFAGIVSDDLSIDCKDGGIPFSIAKVRGGGINLQDFLSSPLLDLSMTMKFLPNEKCSHPPKPGDHVSEIQVNCFECGGLVISIVVSHNVADAATVSTFLRGWAAAARSTGEQISPQFIGHDLFPPIDAAAAAVPDSKSNLHCSSKNLRLNNKYVTRRYLFDASIIVKLKERAESSSVLTSRPTSVEVVSAFLWKCYMNVFNDEPELGKPFTLMQLVSLRRRADPPLPDESFGNLLWTSPAQCTSPRDTSFKDLAVEVKRAIKKIDSGFVKRLQNNGYYGKLLHDTKQAWSEVGSNFMCVSSWCRFGWYDIDFGWGKPAWISLFVCGESDSMAGAGGYFMDTRSGDGIEAWMFLDEKYVMAFEEDEDMQKLVLINPSPLQVGKRI